MARTTITDAQIMDEFIATLKFYHCNEWRENAVSAKEVADYSRLTSSATFKKRLSKLVEAGKIQNGAPGCFMMKQDA